MEVKDIPLEQIRGAAFTVRASSDADGDKGGGVLNKGLNSLIRGNGWRFKESQREAKPLLKTNSPSPSKERGTQGVRLIRSRRL